MIQPLKWPGGKHYLAPKLWDLALPVLDSVVHCVEPYAGGASWALEGLTRGYEKSFCVNDANVLLMNFWGVLANAKLFAVFERACQATPFSQALFETASGLIDHFKTCPCFMANVPDKDVRMVQAAHAFFVCCRQSLAGRMEQFAPLSKARTRRDMNEQCSAWWSAVEGLGEVHEALKRVALLCDEARKVIFAEDSSQTLFYCDPPYLHETRTGDKTYGALEMDQDAHQKLLAELWLVKGRFMLSGYPSGLYDAFAAKAGWKRHDFDLPNNAASGPSKRRMTECVWTNF